jgi:hypothetical protein
MGVMFSKPNVRTRQLRSTTGRLVCASLLALAVLPAGTACEDKAIGRPCNLSTDATPSPSATQGAYTKQATDCPSRLCIKPAVQPGISVDLDTGAYCTVQCTSDNDCNGQTRDPSNPLDTRCRKGFTCAPIFGEGTTLCCAKLCLCRDFFPASVGPLVPDACKSDSDASCS